MITTQRRLIPKTHGEVVITLPTDSKFVSLVDAGQGLGILTIVDNTTTTTTKWRLFVSLLGFKVPENAYLLGCTSDGSATLWSYQDGIEWQGRSPQQTT